MTAPRKRRPWWLHLVVALAMVAVGLAVWAVSWVTRWALGDTWGTVAFLAAVVLGYATFMWSTDRVLTRRRS